MKEIVLSPFMKSKNQYGRAVPYAIAFVYPKNKRPVVLKGMYHIVDKYIEEHYPISVYRMTTWKNGENIGNWRSTDNLSIFFKPVRRGRRVKTEIVVFVDEKTKISKIVRRIPHKWISLYDKAKVKERYI